MAPLTVRAPDPTGDESDESGPGDQDWATDEDRTSGLCRVCTALQSPRQTHASVALLQRQVAVAETTMEQMEAGIDVLQADNAALREKLARVAAICA